MKCVYIISTNKQWGGSEYLWYKMAMSFKIRGLDVVFATKYKSDNVDYLASEMRHIDLNLRFSELNIIQRVINKIFPIFQRTDFLTNAMLKDNPCSVIISQGNNVGSEDMFQLCMDFNFKYYVITQLVTELNYQYINEQRRQELIHGYENAAGTFFVSEQNKKLHEKLLGYSCLNSKVIFNPLNLDELPAEMEFTNLSRTLNCAIVGRIEFFHKGLDVLLEVISIEKWRRRDILFNFYGDGPHIELLRCYVRKENLSNVIIHGHTLKVSRIWSENHVLLLPSRMEGQSVSLSEALACSRTVVATNVGGVAEWIHDNENGFIAKYCTTDSIDDAMERMWYCKHDLQNMGIKANQSWSSSVPSDPVGYINDIIFQ
jgi:glycosyltransferase involved in cell wall biosynthesis